MIKTEKSKDALSKGERKLINLSTGKKKPTTESEKRLVKDIDNIKKKGGQIYIPHD
jgi:hypothetical protein